MKRDAIQTIRLPLEGGSLEPYQVREPRKFERPSRPFTRRALAAAHVVADPRSTREPWVEPAIDWDATLQYRSISHFIEHMAFKGTRSRDCQQINLDAERLGAEVNAHTDKNHTAFHMRGLAGDAGAFVRMLADIVRHSTFPEAELERERQVILHEYTEDEDDALSTAFRLFDKACYGRHALARPVIGSRANIRRFTRAELAAYTQRQYTGANTVVGVAGNVDPDVVVAAALAAFGDMPRGAELILGVGEDFAVENLEGMNLYGLVVSDEGSPLGEHVSPDPRPTLPPPVSPSLERSKPLPSQSQRGSTVQETAQSPNQSEPEGEPFFEMGPLARMTSLRFLLLERGLDASQLSDLDRLTTLLAFDRIRHLEGLKELRSLEAVVLGNDEKGPDLDLTPLANLPKLSSLWAFGPATGFDKVRQDLA